MKAPKLATDLTISVNNGTVVLNGEDTDKQTAQVIVGDKFQIKLNSSNNYGKTVNSNVSFKYKVNAMDYENR